MRELAMDYLSRREHTRVELQRKLMLKGYAESEIEGVLDRLQSQGLQNDQRFVNSFLEQRMRMGNGPMKIRAELNQHGVCSQLVDDVFAAVAVNWCEVAKQLWLQKFKEPPEDIKEKMRRHRFMLQRGFNYEHFKALESSS